MKNKYLVFIIQGYDVQTPEGQLIGVTEYQMIDTSYESALKKAKTLFEKPFYRLSMVIEKYGDS